MSYFIIDLHFSIFIGLFFILSILGCIIDRRRNKNYFKERCILITCFIFYILMFIKFAILPIWIFIDAEMLREMNISLNNYIQIVPFRTIIKTIEIGTWKLQLLGNILLILPIPIFIELFKGKKLSLKETIFLGFKLTISIELIQGLINLLTRYPNKVVDVDDIILNILGVIIAHFILKILDKFKFYQSFKQSSITQ
ncbi:VanZ family protein [Garciella nitratireducens]|uniref:VanZ like family protein n=1 Tax=Garciella nitratireducens DSM 15102 TaxID=1121911 RepID=A0A1T4N1H9_9FIRM|nr:VanZ family protein [Garciella nitratireducens]SJZ72974.1 VanZ like family protein [Garciella nitratireducens DSM 15102]